MLTTGNLLPICCWIRGEPETPPDDLDLYPSPWIEGVLDPEPVRASFHGIILEDAEVAADQLIGGVEGKGLKQANAVFGYTRLMVGSFGLGGGQAALDRALAYALAGDYDDPADGDPPGEPPDAPADDEALQSFLREHLAPTKTPKLWYHVDEFPLTGSGKIQKFVMRDQTIEELTG